jgi:hypothetical protein
MSALEKLSHTERVFLAGCIKTTMLADGVIAESELDDLDVIYRNLDFNDYEEDLEEFEKSVKDEDAFFEMARGISNPEVQDFILRIVYDISLQNGAPGDSQESIFVKLDSLWKK